MFRYSYKVELKRAKAERLGLFLDLERVPEDRKEEIRKRIEMKNKQIVWIKENMHLHTRPEIC